MKYLMLFLALVTFGCTAYSDAPEQDTPVYIDYNLELVDYCLKVEELAITLMYHRQHGEEEGFLRFVVKDNELANHIITDAFMGPIYDTPYEKSIEIVDFGGFYFDRCMEKTLNDT